MLTIPTDLDRWHSNDVSAWLTDLANDETVTDEEYATAEGAVFDSLLAPGPAVVMPFPTAGRAR
jgi:hypothetical protein